MESRNPHRAQRWQRAAHRQSTEGAVLYMNSPFKSVSTLPLTCLHRPVRSTLREEERHAACCNRYKTACWKHATRLRQQDALVHG